jgi:signal transduction histidine kinase
VLETNAQRSRPDGDILVVDDDPNNLVAIGAVLEGQAGKVVCAPSGQEALRLLLARDFAVILMDVEMPALGGIETARLIRSRDRSRHTPIIFVTGHAQDDAEVAAGYALGAVDFLFKPLVPEVLRAKVSVFVELHRRAQELTRQGELLREHERLAHERRLEEERRRWREEAMQDQMRSLAEIDRRKDEFLAMLGHELRNPLAAIALGLDLMRGRLGEAGTPLCTSHGRIEQQVSHLARIVDDLLDLSRINSGKIELRRAPVALADVIEGAASVSRPLIDRRGHRLTIELPDQAITLHADAVRLTQVVSNLLNNAAQYTDDGGTILLRARPVPDGLEVIVRDSGRGIRPELLPRIFEMFVQDQKSAGGGLGLGLTVVKRLVELHGGSVAVRSAGLGHGSEFVVLLPAALLVSASPPTAVAVPTVRPLRIALVEDSADIREMTQELLTMLGHSVEAAEDGEKGVELILRTRPDVALVDMGLPGLDGCGVATRVRAQCGRDGLRLVAMTGFGLDSDRRRAREAGFDDYLVKPADLEALLRALGAGSESV